MIKLTRLLETRMQTKRGSIVQRFKNNVGKFIGGAIYVHKLYANEVIPPTILKKAEKLLINTYPDFKYNTIMFDPGHKMIRFDESPDFDSANEPHVGDYVAIYFNNTIRKGHSDNIWHHKWLWVKDDYSGFNVEQSKRWSKLWLSKLNEPAKGSESHWKLQLRNAGLVNETENEDEDEDEEKIDIDRLYWNDSYLEQIADQLGYSNNFNSNFWRFPRTLYHCTIEEKYNTIKTDGLRPKSDTRGFSSNRHIGPAIFTTSEDEEVPHLKDSYGPIVISINTIQMKSDGYMPEVAQEPDWERANMMTFVLQKLGEEDAYPEKFVDSSEGTTPYTVIVYGAIPTKYLKLEDY